MNRDIGDYQNLVTSIPKEAGISPPVPESLSTRDLRTEVRRAMSMMHKVNSFSDGYCSVTCDLRGIGCYGTHFDRDEGRYEPIFRSNAEKDPEVIDILRKEGYLRNTPF